MRLYIDTCVLPRCRLETAAVYRERFGPELGFELLPMFDIPEWEENLKQNLSLFQEGPLTFHEPVWGVEHTALPGTPGWQESMYHLQLTRKYADLLHPSSMVVHLNNCPVPIRRSDRHRTRERKRMGYPPAAARPEGPDPRIPPAQQRRDPRPAPAPGGRNR